MRFLVVIVTAVLVSAGSVSAQPRFAVQEPEPARLSEREQRAEDLEDVGLALLITGVGFWALETHHPRELCGPPRPNGPMRRRDARDLHVGHRRGVVGRLNPAHPGNLDFMKEDAQRAVDDATVFMDRLGMDHPGKINVDDGASVAEWYGYLRPLRRNEY